MVALGFGEEFGLGGLLEGNDFGLGFGWGAVILRLRHVGGERFDFIQEIGESLGELFGERRESEVLGELLDQGMDVLGNGLEAGEFLRGEGRAGGFDAHDEAGHHAEES